MEYAVKEAFTALAAADPVGEWDEVDVFLAALYARGYSCEKKWGADDPIGPVCL